MKNTVECGKEVKKRMGSSFNLKESRNNLVAKDNRMIQESKFSLGELEFKAIQYLISKIQPDDKDDKIYIFNCKEFLALLNWNKDASYNNVKIMLQNLGDASWWIQREIKGRKKDVLVRWFNIVHMDEGNGDIEISFHEDMFPYLLDLQKHLEEEGLYYTSYRLQNITLMKYRYSPRIYELLKSYQYNNQRWTFENGTGSEYDLQKRIADTVLDKKTRKSISVVPERWKNWTNFKKDILDPAVNEINKYTDIKVAYIGKKEDIHHKKTRAIRTIEFYMVSKTEPEQRETDRIIDVEYNVIEDEQNYHQMTMEELFFQEHKEALEIEEKEKENEEIEESKYPLIVEAVGVDTFSEEQIQFLYNLATGDYTYGIVPLTCYELFACDMIEYYFKYCEATPDETKTSLFNRMKNLLINDYDNIAVKLQRRYARRIYEK